MQKRTCTHMHRDTQKHTHRHTHSQKQASLHWRLKQSIKNEARVVLYTAHYFGAGRVKHIFID